MKYLKTKIVINEKIRNIDRIYVDKSKKTCLICHDNKKDMMCVPCGHVFMCAICANDYMHGGCIICSSPISEMYKVLKN